MPSSFVTKQTLDSPPPPPPLTLRGKTIVDLLITLDLGYLPGRGQVTYLPGRSGVVRWLIGGQTWENITFPRKN